MSKKETLCRYGVFLVGLAVMALAVAVMSKAALGISPVQSVCYVIHRKFPEKITFGTLIFIWNFILVIAQFPFLKKSFGWKNIVQIPLSFFLSFMVDMISYGLVWLEPKGYGARVITMLCGIVILALSISITVSAKAVMNPGEAFVAVLAKALSQPFGKIKAIFDISIISVAIILTVALFGQWRTDIVGVGTLAAALFTGALVGFMNKRVECAVEKICTGGKVK